VYKDMDEWLRIRQRVLVEGVPKRQVLRETGMHWTTLEKILAMSGPPGYRPPAPEALALVGGSGASSLRHQPALAGLP